MPGQDSVVTVEGRKQASTYGPQVLVQADLELVHQCPGNMKGSLILYAVLSSGCEPQIDPKTVIRACRVVPCLVSSSSADPIE